jgi:hypothetical protein
MANMPHVFKDRDVQRVIKAARSAGLDPVSVEVDVKTGRIKVTGSKSDAPNAPGSADTSVLVRLDDVTTAQIVGG